MNTDKIDLSPLDPDRDPERWQSIVTATMVRVDAALESRGPSSEDALMTIAGWSRQLLFAAAAGLAILIPVEIALELRESRAEAAQRLAAVSIAWAEGEATPRGSEILRALADESGR
jgi:hypothetical protein